MFKLDCDEVLKYFSSQTWELWASYPVHLVLIKDKSQYFYVHDRKLNKTTLRDCYSIQGIDYDVD